MLLGYPDHVHKFLYVVDILCSPSDSQEWPTSYVRGCYGLNETVNELASLTLGAVSYLGEWYSHPDGVACEHSLKDMDFMTWLKEHMVLDGMPALLAIVCMDDDLSWYVETLSDMEVD